LDSDWANAAEQARRKRSGIASNGEFRLDWFMVFSLEKFGEIE
jgi:hypothetical protein